MSPRPQSQRDPAASDAVLNFVEKLALTLNNVGLPRMPARVFSTLLVAPDDGMTAADLAETLRISPAAVSGAVRYLVQVGMAQRGRRPGERRDHYYIGEDMWYETVSARDQIYHQLASVLDEGRSAVGPETVAGRRLADTRDFMAFIGKEMALVVDRYRAQRES